jgi:phospholipid/cholesterol/gamma-HCH transport system substrate-binding protein
MNRLLANKALAVGLLVAVGFAAFLVAFTFFRKGGYSEKESYEVHAFFQDATGLSWKSRVQIAGIPVGEVARITLEGHRARLDLRVKNEIDLRKDACLSKRFPSALLPDALLDAAPGTAAAPSLRSLPVEQREITCVKEATSVEALLESLSKIAEDVQVVSGELAQVVGGSQGSIQNIIRNLERMSAGLAQTTDEGAERIEAILRNTQAFTGTLREVTDRDRQRYHEITANVQEASARLVAVLESVQKMVGEGEEGAVQESIGGVRQSLDKLNRSMDNIEKLTTGIAEGKGVAGKLLADERLGEKVATSIEGVSDYVDRLVRLRVQMHLRSEFLAAQQGGKVYAGVRLLPRPDKFYEIELVSDPRGVDTITNETITSETDGVTSTTRTSRVLNEQDLRFSFQLGRRYGPLTVRAGIIESSGGAGADFHLLDDRLQVSFSLYQFDRPSGVEFPNLKIWANYTFLRYLYATIGTEDVLNRWETGRYPGGRDFALGRDAFFGGGLLFTDDDLKTLFGLGGGAISGAATSE